jgi:hypothetical protein
MKRMKSGLFQALSSALIALFLVVAVSFGVKQEWIPAYSTIVLSIFNIITSLLSLKKMRRWGIFYTIGWLAGAVLFYYLGLLDTLDIVFNIVAPITMLFLRLYLALKKAVKTAVRHSG